MILLSRRSLLALAAVVDIAMHARPQPVAAKALAGRLDLPPRHLEGLLQALVHAGILKGVRGPRGGYELARERRRVTAGEILRAVATEANSEAHPAADCRLIERALAPMIETAGRSFLEALDLITVDDMCEKAAAEHIPAKSRVGPDFTI